MAKQDLRKWQTFFCDAGVPTELSNDYATLFCKHRIKENLLGDLTKDILKEMGITVVGDMISILKHAKAVHAKLEQEKLSIRLGYTQKMLGEKNPQLRPQQNKKKASPVHQESKSKTLEALPIRISPKPSKKIADDSDLNVVMTVKNAGPVPQKRPIKNTLSLSERFASEEVVPPKVARKVPESYTIQANRPLLKEKSKQQIPQDVKADLPIRKSAFERLGRELTIPKKESDMLMPKMKITKVTKSPIMPPATTSAVNKGGSSVFNRLGETEQKSSDNQLTTITIRTVPGQGSRVVSNGGDKKSLKSSVLPPLKPTNAVRPVKTVLPITTKTTSSTSNKKSSPEPEKKSVFSRLGSPKR